MKQRSNDTPTRSQKISWQNLKKKLLNRQVTNTKGKQLHGSDKRRFHYLKKFFEKLSIF